MGSSSRANSSSSSMRTLSVSSSSNSLNGRYYNSRRRRCNSICSNFRLTSSNNLGLARPRLCLCSPPHKVRNYLGNPNGLSSLTHNSFRLARFPRVRLEWALDLVSRRRTRIVHNQRLFVRHASGHSGASSGVRTGHRCWRYEWCQWRWQQCLDWLRTRRLSGTWARRRVVAWAERQCQWERQFWES